MAVSPEDLRRHCASLSDEALLSINRDELTAMAQKVCDGEISKRNISLEAESGMELDDEEFHASPAFSDDAEEVEDGFHAAVFSALPTAAEDAADAARALTKAGIPNRIVERDVEEEFVPGHREFQVVVPPAFSLQATGVLDLQIFNPRLEAEWRTQLESLSDEQFGELRIDSLCEGLLDRAERLKKLYDSV